MRLLDLAFDRYGPFDGLRLNFDPQARLHIVYGANEAGKSCALEALGDLFYGAPRRAEVGFLRPRDLRLGATLRGRNGQILQFFRRRGDRNTLLDATGGALPDDALTPFLGAATREIFYRAFGLNAEKLRAGGDDMLRADGEIGASLLAAASGLKGLIDLRKGFEAEAEAIFGDRKASHRTFYQALQRFDAAREQERAATVSDSALRKLAAEIAEHKEQLAEIANAQKLTQGERRRLERQLKTAPIARNLARLRGEFSGFDDLGDLAPDADAQLAAILAAREKGAETAAGMAQARAAARQECDAAEVDELLLAQAEKIEDLIRASGAYAKSAADLPRRETALRDIRQSLLRRAQECGLPDAQALRAAAPDAAALKAAEKLCAKGRELATLQQEPQRALAEEEALFARLRAAQGSAPTLDPQILGEKLRACGPVAHWDAAWREAAAAAAENARALAEKCARLTPPLGDLDLFARAPCPDAARIERAARERDLLEAREGAARQKAQDARAALAHSEKELARLERQGAVASLDDLLRTRAGRDAEWRFLRAILFGEAASPDDLHLREKTGRFETLTAEADARADALRLDAARVAAADAAREKIAEARREAAEADALLVKLAHDRAALDDDWAQAWRACRVAPASPREMIAWRGRADSLLEARESLARLQAKAREWETRLGEARPNLLFLIEECGLPPLPSLDSAALAQRIEARLAEVAKARDAAREAQAKLADAPSRIARHKERLAVLAAEQAAWRAEWRAALAALRLDEDATFEETQARIALWRALPGEWEDEQERASRVGKIVADLGDFEQGLDALLALCARDLPSRPVEAAVAQLRDRLAAARANAALRQKARERLDQAEVAAQRAEAELAEAEGAVAAFRLAAEQAGLRDDPASLLRRLGESRNLRAAIEAEGERLFLVADGLDQAALDEEARDFDAGAARLRLDEIERQAQAEEERAREIFAGLRKAESELARLQNAPGAEAAVQARENARAEILDESRRWAVLKLASLLVEAGLERARRRRQDPLLARAGALFSTLTEGRYAGLDQAFGDDDCLRLRAHRADDAVLDLAALSEGARDQLYLALRLAFLEDYADRHEAPPFIGDDLFASFDDRRVAAGLRSLAEASGYLQPILFTHHAHILDIAGATLAGKAQILRLE